MAKAAAVKAKYPKLPKAFKKKWLKALRSGVYKQTSGRLLDIDTDDVKRHCCLGVACKVVGYSDRKIDDEGLLMGKDYRKAPKILHGDDEINPVVKKLTEMNDSGKYGFKRIANWIEKNL